MRPPPGALAFMLAGVISGCDLEFVDVRVETPSVLDLRMHTDSDLDSVWINASLHRGFDESGERRKVRSGLQVANEQLSPQVAGESVWWWNTSVPGGIAEAGRMMVQPPTLEGLRLPKPIEATIPVRIGSDRLEIHTGEAIPLRFDFVPTSPEVHWRVRLFDAEGNTHYTAESRILPSGVLLIPSDFLPSSAPDPYRVELDFYTQTSNDLEEEQYVLRFVTSGRLHWVILRPDPDLVEAAVGP